MGNLAQLRKDFTTMSYEEQLDKVRQIRRERVLREQPATPKAQAPASKQRSKKPAKGAPLDITSLSEEERNRLIALLSADA